LRPTGQPAEAPGGRRTARIAHRRAGRSPVSGAAAAAPAPPSSGRQQVAESSKRASQRRTSPGSAGVAGGDQAQLVADPGCTGQRGVAIRDQIAGTGRPDPHPRQLRPTPPPAARLISSADSPRASGARNPGPRPPHRFLSPGQILLLPLATWLTRRCNAHETAKAARRSWQRSAPHQSNQRGPSRAFSHANRNSAYPAVPALLHKPGPGQVRPQLMNDQTRRRRRGQRQHSPSEPGQPAPASSPPEFQPRHRILIAAQRRPQNRASAAFPGPTSAPRDTSLPYPTNVSCLRPRGPSKPATYRTK